MNIFLTGSTGYIGSVVAEKLQAAGHNVIGLARSDEAATRLKVKGILPYRGDLQNAESLIQAVRESDGTIHAGIALNAADQLEIDRVAVETMLDALEGSNKLFIYTSVTLVCGDTGDRVVDETIFKEPPSGMAKRLAVEQKVLAAAQRGIRSIAIRPPLVYGRGGGPLASFVAMARKEGFSRYIGTGENNWSSVHVDDLADLYICALERADAGSLYNAAAGEPVSFREIAGAIARAVDSHEAVRDWSVEDAARVWGPFVYGLIANSQVSARKAVRELNWHSQAASVLEDIECGSYRT